MPTFDWMHVLALAAGALATALYTRTASTSSSTPTTPTLTAKPTTAAATSASSTSMTGSPLFDALLKVVEGKLSDLIAVEPGPDGSPMFTVRVVLASESPATTAATPTPSAAK